MVGVESVLGFISTSLTIVDIAKAVNKSFIEKYLFLPSVVAVYEGSNSVSKKFGFFTKSPLELLVPTKDDFSRNPELAKYFYRTFINSIQPNHKTLVHAVMPTPLIALLGMNANNRVEMVNNSTFKRMKRAKTNLQWELKTNGKNIEKIFILDNSSIPKPSEGSVISLKSDLARGAVKNKDVLKRLNKIFLETLCEPTFSKLNEVNLYLNCSPVSALEIGKAIKDNSKTFNLYHWNGEAYELMIKIKSNNEAIFYKGR